MDLREIGRDVVGCIYLAQDMDKWLVPSIHFHIFRVVFSLQFSQQKFCMNFSSLPCILHASPISSFLACSH